MRIFNIRIIAVVALLAVSGCKEAVYTNLSEQEVNEMIVVLAMAGIEFKRSRIADSGQYDLLVNSRDLAAAAGVLSGQGYPKERFTSLGDVFEDSGLVGTPFEERAKMTHALNQELSSTLLKIDGVRDASVHIVLPERNGLNRALMPASASVLVTYEAGFNQVGKVSQIKSIVAYAVPELEIENVSLVLLSADTIAVTPAAVGMPGAANASAGSESFFRGGNYFDLQILAILLICISLAAAGIRQVWTRFVSFFRS